MANLNNNNGWIKLHRSLIDWEWYQDASTARMFIHCLIKANHEDKRWRGIEIKRGSFITSYEKLAYELGISKKSVRTALKHLTWTHEVAQCSNSKYTMITILNYDKYQEAGTPTGTQGAQQGHSKGTQGAPTKNDKNEENDKKIINSPQNSFPSSSKTKTELIPDYNKVNDIEISDELMKKYFPN